MTTSSISLQLNLNFTQGIKADAPPAIDVRVAEASLKPIQDTQTPQGSGWTQTKYIGHRNITSSITWNDALLILSRLDGTIVWRTLNTMKLNGNTLQTNYNLGQPTPIGNSIFYAGSDSETNWSIAKLDPVGRQITATSSNALIVFGITSDGTNLWGISEKNIYLFNPDDLSLINSYPVKGNNPDILMYNNGCLVMGDSVGTVTVFNSSTMAPLGVFTTGYNAASLSVLSPTEIAVSSCWEEEAAVTVLDPVDLTTTTSSLGSITYNGFSSAIVIGTNYITATPRGIGLYQVDSEGQWNFQEMLLDESTSGWLNVDNLIAVSATKFIATGATGTYVFKYDPSSSKNRAITGEPCDQRALPPLREKRRKEMQLLKA